MEIPNDNLGPQACGHLTLPFSLSLNDHLLYLSPASAVPNSERLRTSMLLPHLFHLLLCLLAELSPNSAGKLLKSLKCVCMCVLVTLVMSDSL